MAKSSFHIGTSPLHRPSTSPKFQSTVPLLTKDSTEKRAWPPSKGEIIVRKGRKKKEEEETKEKKRHAVHDCLIPSPSRQHANFVCATNKRVRPCGGGQIGRNKQPLLDLGEDPKLALGGDVDAAGLASDDVAAVFGDGVIRQQAVCHFCRYRGRKTGAIGDCGLKLTRWWSGREEWRTCLSMCSGSWRPERDG